MEIKKVEFVKGVVQGDEFWQEEKPQIAFYGRSNVGKSSVINALLNKGAVARPSGTPGKTREINFFDINNSLFFVDLPGYGYAKMSKQQQEGLRRLILWFVGETEASARIHVMILDAKVGLTELDIEMLQILKEERASQILVILNKVDKLNQKELSLSIKKTRENVPPFIPLIPFSAQKKQGVDAVWQQLDNYLL